MSYIICEHIPKVVATNYAIFKSDSFEWSHWQSTLDLAISAILTDPKTHDYEPIRDNTLACLSSEKHLRLIVIPELLSLPELHAQHPELFI